MVGVAADGSRRQRVWRSLIFCAFALVAAGDQLALEDVVPVWGGGMGHVDQNHSHLGRELLQVDYHQKDVVWERNGERLKAGNIPEDSALYTNRFQLYDRYGRWMIDATYVPPPVPKKTGYAKQLTEKSKMTAPNVHVC